MCVDKHKIIIVKNAKLHIKNYTHLFKFDLKNYNGGDLTSNPKGGWLKDRNGGFFFYIFKLRKQK